MAGDQRYCLECGERRPQMSSLLSQGPPGTSPPGTSPPVPPSKPPASSATGAESVWSRSGTLNVIAGIGVLLLAMGVGVLIGRSGSSKGSSAPQVITVSAGGGGSSTSASSETTFTGDWPAGTKGYTVQLQTLPVTGTSVSAVEAAKSSATAKGAKGVGALKSDEFSSLPAGHYVIYAGVYPKRSDAQKALTGLKKSFPGATVIAVSSGSGGTSGAASEKEVVPQPGGTGESINHPAPPSVLEGLNHAKGKSYEEKSKNLPNVVSTG
jgi:hypothetical protein